MVGPSGPYGLSYPGAESALRLLGVPRREWAELFTQLRVLEASALRQMRANQK